MKGYCVCRFCGDVVPNCHIQQCAQNPDRERNLEKIREGLKGKVPWNKGIHDSRLGWSKGLTKETDKRIAKCSKARKGIPSWTGRKHTKESRMKMSKAKLGKHYPKLSQAKRIRSKPEAFFKSLKRNEFIPINTYTNCWIGLKTVEDLHKSYQRRFDRAIRERFLGLLWFVFQDSALSYELDQIDRIIEEEFGRQNFSSIMLNEGLVTWHHSIITYCLSREGIKYYGVSKRESIPFK